MENRAKPGKVLLQREQMCLNYINRCCYNISMKYKSNNNVKREVSNMLKEFKEFAIKGNVIDIATGVIIAGAFGKIVSSLVNDLVMPILGILIGGINFTNLKYVITPASGNIAEVAFKYGAFIQSVIDFLIISFSIFLFIKMFSLRKKKEQESAPAPAAPSNEEVLLQEIRDLLKNKQI